MVKIGMLDSGFGGLSVVREAKRQLPGAQVVFFGDNGRAPYGPLTKETIVGYTRQALDFLAGRAVDIAVIACNTATVAAYDQLKDRYPFPVVGVIEPGIQAALSATKNKKVGVIATEFTVRSRAHEQGIKAVYPEAQVIGQACPDLVLLVEAGLIDGPAADEAVSRYLKTFRGTAIDTLILGCTHFPPLTETIRRHLDAGVAIVDPAVATIARVKEMLAAAGLAADDPAPRCSFYTSGDPELFARAGTAILGWPIDEVQKVDLTVNQA